MDGFYFAVATLTTSSIADPDLTIIGAPIKIFTVFYVLLGIGILVELARQLGFAYIEIRRAERAAKAAQTKQSTRNLSGVSDVYVTTPLLRVSSSSTPSASRNGSTET